MARMGERRVLGPRRDDKATDGDAESPRRESDDDDNGMRLMGVYCRVCLMRTSLRRNLKT